MVGSFDVPDFLSRMRIFDTDGWCKGPVLSRVSGKASITIGLPPVTVPAGLPRPLMGLPSVPADIVVEEGRTAFVRAVLKQK
jgi:hypothetical protein